MKILVTVKRVEDPESKIKVNADGSGIVTDGINYKVNPFDEIAVEEALRLKDANDGEVVVLSIGSGDAVAEIRSALAMGADRGILVKTDGPVDTAAAARIVAKIAEEEEPDLVLMGKQAVDDDQGQAGQIVAQLLGWGQVTQASKRADLEDKAPGIAIDGDTATVTREVDGGLEDLKLKLPGVVTADLRLNLPRYASLPGIMKAKKKPLDERTPDELGVDTTPQIKVLGLKSPPARAGGEMVPDVATLLEKLKSEAKVL